MVVLPTVSWGDVALLLVYAMVLWLPGGLVGALGGVRGWTLAAGAPLLTYAMAGLAGPWSSAIGIGWGPLTFAAATVVFAGVAAGLRRLAGRDQAPESSGWARSGHLGVAVCCALAAGVGATAVLVGFRSIRAVPQGFDAPLQANGIRWIAETGDAGLYSMTRVNWYESPRGVFYPNGYHVVASVVYQLTGRDIPSVLDANTALLACVLALGVAALVRRFGGRAVHAGASALVVVAATSFWDLVARGPLLPYALGVALVPVAVIFVVDFLDAPSRRARIAPGLPLVLGAVGLLCLHPAVLITAVVFALPMAVVRWWGAPATILREVAALTVAGIVTGGLAAAQLGGVVQSAGTPFEWPANLTPATALGQVLLFQHTANADLVHSPAIPPQLWLTAALIVGLLRFRRIGPLRWVGGTAVIFVSLFVVDASSDAPWVKAITAPWWNDQYRLIGVAVVALGVVAGHGIAEVQSGVVGVARRAELGRRVRVGPTATAAMLAAVVLAGFVGASNGLYLARNEARLRLIVDVGGPATSPLEVQAYDVLRSLARPGERVMNDRMDGSVWMYALDGVQPVAGHYSSEGIGPAASLLTARFNQYDTDAAVRAAATRLNVRWVIVGRGFLLDSGQREPGLVALDRVRALRPVYANPDVMVFELMPQ